MPLFPVQVVKVAPGAAIAPMPGMVVVVNASVGAEVKAGAVLHVTGFTGALLGASIGLVVLGQVVVRRVVDEPALR